MKEACDNCRSFSGTKLRYAEGGGRWKHHEEGWCMKWRRGTKREGCCQEWCDGRTPEREQEVKLRLTGSYWYG